MHTLYDNESSPKLSKWDKAHIKAGNRGHTLKIVTQKYVFLSELLSLGIPCLKQWYRQNPYIH